MTSYHTMIIEIPNMKNQGKKQKKRTQGANTVANIVGGRYQIVRAWTVDIQGNFHTYDNIASVRQIIHAICLIRPINTLVLGCKLPARRMKRISRGEGMATLDSTVCTYVAWDSASGQWQTFPKSSPRHGQSLIQACQTLLIHFPPEIFSVVHFHFHESREREGL